LAGWWGLPRPIIKIPPRRKRGRDPGLGELPKIWGFPFNIYAMAWYVLYKIRHPRFNIFAMAEVAMYVPNKRYYIEKLQILMQKTVYVQVL